MHLIVYWYSSSRLTEYNKKVHALHRTQGSRRRSIMFRLGNDVASTQYSPTYAMRAKADTYSSGRTHLVFMSNPPFLNTPPPSTQAAYRRRQNSRPTRSRSSFSTTSSVKACFFKNKNRHPGSLEDARFSLYTSFRMLSTIHSLSANKATVRCESVFIIELSTKMSVRKCCVLFFGILDYILDHIWSVAFPRSISLWIRDRICCLPESLSLELHRICFVCLLVEQSQPHTMRVTCHFSDSYERATVLFLRAL